MSEMTKQAEAFFAHLRVERQSSQNTVLAYQRDLAKVTSFCEKKKIAGWDALQVEHVRQIAAQEKRNGNSANSINRLLSAVRSFYKYLIGTGQCEHNPAQSITGPRGATKLPQVLDTDHAAQLLDAQVEESFLGRRDQAILELFYSSALRLSELVDLEMNHLDLQAGMVYVRGKGGRDRYVPVGRKAREALAEWFKWRPTVGGPTGPQVNNVFVTHHGNKLTPRAVQLRVKAAGQRNLGQHLHPHTLRHTCATHVLQSSHCLRTVQELLGHADIATTQIYTHLDLPYLLSVYKDAHPRGKRQSVNP